jgi:nicotinamidase-related amidase
VLKIENSLLLIIDVQEKLFRVIHEREILLSNLLKLVKGINILNVPIIFTEQNPAGLGKTLPEITELISSAGAPVKFSFSCCGETEIINQIRNSKRNQILVCGIEAHICVYQTSLDLLSGGYEVHLVSDCVSSRSAQNRELALRRLEREGVKVSGVEMALFELLQTAKAPQFKAISALVK